MLDVYACIFYDNFEDGWRYHVWFSFFSVVSPVNNCFSTPNETIAKAEECVQNILAQPFRLHNIIYGSYSDYFMEVFQQSLNEGL